MQRNSCGLSLPSKCQFQEAESPQAFLDPWVHWFLTWSLQDWPSFPVECQVHTHIWELVFLVLESITAWSCVCSSGRNFMVSSSIHGSHESFHFVMSLDFLCCFILWPLSYQCSCFSEQVSPTPATDIRHHQTFINFHEQVLHLLEFNLDAELSSS